MNGSDQFRPSIMLGSPQAISLLLAFFTASLFMGCASPQPRKLTLGLYNVPADSLMDVKEAGFDVVTAPTSRNTDSYLSEAARAGIKVLLPSGAFSTNAARMNPRLQRFDLHPATWGWYLIDEPDLHDIAPKHVARITRQFQRRALKPGVLVLASGSAARAYGEDCDLLMVDFYPVPWAPVSRFAKEMRLASFARGDKPYMAVVQSFDWNYFADVLGQTNDLRAPTIAEIRCMSYMALALEARGLFFYAFKARDWNLAESPLWRELKYLVQELRRYAPLFEHPPLWWPSEFEYSDPANMYNEVQDGIILSRFYYVPKPANDLEPGYYFLVINTTGQEVGYSFRPPFAGLDSVRQGDDSVPLQDGWLHRNYRPYEVVIFGPLASPLFNRP